MGRGVLGRAFRTSGRLKWPPPVTTLGKRRNAMMMSQLGRVLLSSSSASPDEQEGRTDDEGSYGGLMDAIDRAVKELTAHTEQSEPSS